MEGVCIWAEAPPPRYYRLWSTSGWYVSYWNAFLLKTMETLWIGHCNPFSSDPFVFNENNFASVIAELSQAWCKWALTLSQGERHVMLLSQCMRALVKLPQSVTVAFFCAGFEQEDLLLNKS